jgi:HK97 family phage major capsid protein
MASNETTAILKAISDQGEKFDKRLAEVEKKATQPAVNPTQIYGLNLGLTPGRDSGGYSILKSAKYCAGFATKEEIKEEWHVHEQLAALYKKHGYGVSYGQKSFIVPFATEHIIDAEAPGIDGGKLRKELREKMAMSIGGFDPYEAASHARKMAPWNMQKAMGTVTDTAGGVLVGFPTLGELIDMQRNVEAFANAGSQEVTLPPNGRLQYPKLVGGASANFIGEAQQIPESQEVTGNLDLIAKKLGVFVTMNNELLRFATPSAEGMIRMDMARVAALKADFAMLEGTGGVSIKGLITYTPTATTWTSGSDYLIIHTAAQAGANGDTFSATDPATMEGKLPDEVDSVGLSWIMRRNMYGAIMNKRADAAVPGDAAGPFMFWTARGVAAQKPPDELYGAKTVRTSQVSNTRVKGSSSDLTYVILGKFSDWITARSGIMEFLASALGDTALQNDQTKIRGIQHIDAGPRHAASFCLCDTLLIA